MLQAKIQPLMQSVGKILKSRTSYPTRLSKCSVTYVLSVTVLLRSALTWMYQMFRLLNGILPKTSTLHMCAAESERLSFTPITRKNTAVTVLKKHTVTAIFTMLCTMTTAKRLTCTRLTLFRGLIQRALHLTNHICGLYLSFTANRATRAEVRALSA